MNGTSRHNARCGMLHFLTQYIQNGQREHKINQYMYLKQLYFPIIKTIPIRNMNSPHEKLFKTLYLKHWPTFVYH